MVAGLMAPRNTQERRPSDQPPSKSLRKVKEISPNSKSDETRKFDEREVPHRIAREGMEVPAGTPIAGIPLHIPDNSFHSPLHTMANVACLVARADSTPQVSQSQGIPTSNGRTDYHHPPQISLQEYHHHHMQPLYAHPAPNGCLSILNEAHPVLPPLRNNPEAEIQKLKRNLHEMCTRVEVLQRTVENPIQVLSDSGQIRIILHQGLTPTLKNLPDGSSVLCIFNKLTGGGGISSQSAQEEDGDNKSREALLEIQSTRKNTHSVHQGEDVAMDVEAEGKLNSEDHEDSHIGNTAKKRKVGAAGESAPGGSSRGEGVTEADERRGEPELRGHSGPHKVNVAPSNSGSGSGSNGSSACDIDGGERDSQLSKKASPVLQSAPRNGRSARRGNQCGKRKRNNWTEEENSWFMSLVLENLDMEEMELRRMLARQFAPKRTHEQCANHLRILRSQGRLPPAKEDAVTSKALKHDRRMS